MRPRNENVEAIRREYVEEYRTLSVGERGGWRWRSNANELAEKYDLSLSYVLKIIRGTRGG